MSDIVDSERKRIEGFEAQLEASQNLVEERKRRQLATNQKFMYARVLLFALALAGFVATAWTGDDRWGWWLMIPGIIAFTLTVIAHLPHKKRTAATFRLLDILAQKKQRVGKSTHAEPKPATCPQKDEQEDFPEHVLEDLGVFGERMSLFSLVWTGSSEFGRRKTIDALAHPLRDLQEIQRRQEIVAELRTEQALRFELERRFKICQGHPNSEEIETLMTCGLSNTNLPGLMMVRLMTATVVISMVSAFVYSIGWLFLVAVFAAVLGNYFYREALAKSSEFRNALSDAAPYFDMIESCNKTLASAKSAGLKDLAGVFRDFLEDDAATFSLAQARRKLSALSAYKAGLVYVFLSWPTFYDLHFTIPLNSWWSHKKPKAQRAFNALGELEFLMCLATLGEEQSAYTMPKALAAEDGPRLSIQAGRHPFLDFASAVENHLALGADYKIGLITGSNMSGKSTYIKMCGLNLVLAQIGGPVRAASMSWTPLSILTDINVKDSLDDGRSYFAVEVERILEVVKSAQADPFQLALLDEMYRGTNTHEKVAAGIEVTRWLAQLGTLALVATHDHEFTDLESSEPNLGIRNFHFSEEIGEREMLFSYRLKDGPATSRNALKLLEISGYPKELVDRALKRSQNANE